MQRTYFIFIILITFYKALFAQLPQLHIIGEPELSPTEIVAVIDPTTGKFCAAIKVITDLQGFGYSSDIGVVRVDFSMPGRDMVFLLPDERILEIYHPDYQPQKIIFSEMGINLQPKQVWIIKLTGDKELTKGIPILIETNTDSVEISIDGKSHGINQALMVSPGKHEILLSKPDYETIIDTIVVDENNKQFQYTMLIDLVMVFVKGGTFQMGDTFGDGRDWEKPVHEVTVSDFYIGKYEVTNAQFCKFLNEKGYQEEGGRLWLIKSYCCKILKQGNIYETKAGYENHPVVEVTWYGARAFCQWAGGRLPTEAEWEYACRGGNKSKNFKYSGSNYIDEVAWYWGNSAGGQTHPVGSKQHNELGIYDMSGNVGEWCADWYHQTYYSNSPASNPQGPTAGRGRVLRGGSWGYGMRSVSAASREGDKPNKRYDSIGFRFTRTF